MGGSRKIRRGVLGGAIALGALVVLPANALAVTIGSDLKPAPGPTLGFGCGPSDGCAVAQTKLPGDPHPLRSPIRGVIRKWRFRKNNTGETYPVRLWVVRKQSNGAWEFLRHSRFKTIGSPAGTYAFGARLRIRKGDRIAMELSPGDHSGIGIAHTGARDAQWFPAPLMPGSFEPDAHSDGFEYPWNAKIRRRH